MARGLSRDLAREKNAKKASNDKNAKGNKESLTPAQRAERDAKAMAEKKAAKEAQKAKDLATGKLTPEQVKEEEMRKAKMREKQKLSQFASNNPLLAKNLVKKWYVVITLLLLARLCNRKLNSKSCLVTKYA